MSRFRAGLTSTGAAAGLIALLMAMSGTAVAGQSLIGSNDIKNHSIKAVDLSKNSVTTLSIADGTITGQDIKDGSLSRADLADGTLTGKQIKKDSLTGVNLADNSISGAEIYEPSLGRVPEAGNAQTVDGVRTEVVGTKITDCAKTSQELHEAGPGYDLSAFCFHKGPRLALTVVAGSKVYDSVHTDNATNPPANHDEAFYDFSQKAILLLRPEDTGVSAYWGEVTVVGPDGHAVDIRYSSFAANSDHPFDFEVQAFITQLG